MKLSHKKIGFNKEREVINISFRMSKELYDKIKTAKMVEDFGLAILAGIEKEVNVKEELDSPSLDTVEVKEKYDD